MMPPSRRGFLKAGGALVAAFGTPARRARRAQRRERSPARSPARSRCSAPRGCTSSRTGWRTGSTRTWPRAARCRGRSASICRTGSSPFSKNGAAPARVQAWHVWGNPTELYSEVPWFDPQGRSHPYSAETSDDFALIVADLGARPPADGAARHRDARGAGDRDPASDIFPPADATIRKTPNTGVIPRAPTRDLAAPRRLHPVRLRRRARTRRRADSRASSTRTTRASTGAS